MGLFYIIGTPIGNLSELTPRAVQIISTLDYLLVEDTRVTIKLLNAFDLKVKMISYHANNEKMLAQKVISDLDAGMKIGLVSDAGMPVISDPGHEIVNLIKSHTIKHSIQVISGPSAFTNAFVASGFPAPFTFMGFLKLEKQKDYKTLLEQLSTATSTLIYYLSVHDTFKLLDYLSVEEVKNQIVLARELTKMNETYYYIDDIKIYPIELIKLKGEFVILFKQLPKEELAELTSEIIGELLNKMDKKQVITHLTQKGYRKNNIKQEILNYELAK
jgi:16S rRNA (cytidine1402-2'-O)-methyltransferase